MYEQKEKQAILGRLIRPLIGLGLTGAAGLGAAAYYKAQQNKENRGLSKTVGEEISQETKKTRAEKLKGKVESAEAQGKRIGEGIIGAGKALTAPIFSTIGQGYRNIWGAPQTQSLLKRIGITSNDT